MQVSEAMTPVTLAIGPAMTLKRAAVLMAERGVGASVVIDPDLPGPGILSERDIVRAVAEGKDLEAEPVFTHASSSPRIADASWSLEEAASTMVRAQVRHLIVTSRGEMVGMLSVRDIMRVWTDEGAECDITPSIRASALSEVVQ